MVSYVSWTDYASRSEKLNCQPGDCGGETAERGGRYPIFLPWKLTDHEPLASIKTLNRGTVPRTVMLAYRSRREAGKCDTPLAIEQKPAVCAVLRCPLNAMATPGEVRRPS